MGCWDQHLQPYAGWWLPSSSLALPPPRLQPSLSLTWTVVIAFQLVPSRTVPSWTWTFQVSLQDSFSLSTVLIMAHLLRSFNVPPTRSSDQTQAPQSAAVTPASNVLPSSSRTLSHFSFPSRYQPGLIFFLLIDPPPNPFFTSLTAVSSMPIVLPSWLMTIFVCQKNTTSHAKPASTVTAFFKLLALLISFPFLSQVRASVYASFGHLSYSALYVVICAFRIMAQFLRSISPFWKKKKNPIPSC